MVAERLEKVCLGRQVLILAIPKGGVVLGAEIARKLKAPLTVLITKKIGAPYNPELAIAALAEEGELVLNQELVSRLNPPQFYLQAEEKKTRKLIKSYRERFRKGKSLLVKGREVVVVDDGMATGLTMEAALRWLRQERVKRMILALPAAATDSLIRVRPLADDCVCLHEAADFMSVGQYYEEFGQVSERQVMELLSAKIEKI